MSFNAKRSDFLFDRLYRLKNKSCIMSEELVLFEIERLLLDGANILGLLESDPATLDFLFNVVSRMGNDRLGMPPHKNIHMAVEYADQSSYKQLLENMIRPAMYQLEMRGGVGFVGKGVAEADILFTYRCFNACYIITEHDCNRIPGYDFEFSVDAYRKARDVVGEWLDVV